MKTLKFFVLLVILQVTIHTNAQHGGARHTTLDSTKPTSVDEESDSKDSIRINDLSLWMRKTLGNLATKDSSNKWLYITLGQSETFLFKEVSKVQFEDNIQVWIKHIPFESKLTTVRKETASKVVNSATKQKILTKYAYTMSLYIMDCEYKKIGVKSVILYDNNGSVISNDSTPYLTSFDLDDVIPETLGEEILNTICDYYNFIEH